MHHARAQVLGEGSPYIPAPPALEQGRVLQPQHVAHNRAHGDRHPQIAGGRGFAGFLGTSWPHQ